MGVNKQVEVAIVPGYFGMVWIRTLHSRIETIAGFQGRSIMASGTGWPLEGHVEGLAGLWLPVICDTNPTSVVEKAGLDISSYFTYIRHHDSDSRLSLSCFLPLPKHQLCGRKYRLTTLCRRFDAFASPLLHISTFTFLDLYPDTHPHIARSRKQSMAKNTYTSMEIKLIVANVLLLFITPITVSLRLLSRKVAGARIGVDDYMICGSLAPTLTLPIISFVGKSTCLSTSSNKGN